MRGECVGHQMLGICLGNGVLVERSYAANIAHMLISLSISEYMLVNLYTKNKMGFLLNGAIFTIYLIKK